MVGRVLMIGLIGASVSAYASQEAYNSASVELDSQKSEQVKEAGSSGNANLDVLNQSQEAIMKGQSSNSNVLTPPSSPGDVKHTTPSKDSTKSNPDSNSESEEPSQLISTGDGNTETFTTLDRTSVSGDAIIQGTGMTLSEYIKAIWETPVPVPSWSLPANNSYGEEYSEVESGVGELYNRGVGDEFLSVDSYWALTIVLQNVLKINSKEFDRCTSTKDGYCSILEELSTKYHEEGNSDMKHAIGRCLKTIADYEPYEVWIDGRDSDDDGEEVVKKAKELLSKIAVNQ
jgi:hypothetical protein